LVQTDTRTQNTRYRSPLGRNDPFLSRHIGTPLPCFKRRQLKTFFYNVSLRPF